MKGNRLVKENETKPVTELVRNESGFEIRFNFVEKEASEDHDASYDYNYVKVSTLTKKAIKTAIIRDRYPDINDEIAIINNKESGIQKDIDAYKDYQALRAQGDEIANEILK